MALPARMPSQTGRDTRQSLALFHFEKLCYMKRVEKGVSLQEDPLCLESDKKALMLPFSSAYDLMHRHFAKALGR